jgi:hypothetical protein
MKILILSTCFIYVSSQSSFATPVINASENGIVYLLLVILFSVAYGVPIVMWMYRFFNKQIKDRATKKLDEIRLKILDLNALQKLRRMSKRTSKSLSVFQSGVSENQSNPETPEAGV